MTKAKVEEFLRLIGATHIGYSGREKRFYYRLGNVQKSLDLVRFRRAF